MAARSASSTRRSIACSPSIKIPPTDGTPMPPRPMGTVLSPDGSTVYVSFGRARSIGIFDVKTRKLTRVIEDVGGRPWGIGISPDGRKIYTANGPSGDVSIVDVESGKVEKRSRSAAARGASRWRMRCRSRPSPSPRRRANGEADGPRGRARTDTVSG